MIGAWIATAFSSTHILAPLMLYIIETLFLITHSIIEPKYILALKLSCLF